MPHRIVSLLPAATEIVCALGAESQLVGRSHECDYPPSVQRLPVCSSPHIDVSGSSRDIDEQVKQTLRSGLSLFEVDVEQIKRLEPTLILTQAQCEVCAVSLADVEAALAALLVPDPLAPALRGDAPEVRGSCVVSRPQIVSLSPNQLDDVFADIRRVASVLDREQIGEAVVGDLADRFGCLSQALPREAVSIGEPHALPSVVCIEWLEPLMTAGNWVPELVALAGGRNLLSEKSKHSPWLDWHDLVAADPDVIVLMPCGWGIERTRSELHWLTNRPEWPSLRAVRGGRVFLADGHHYFNRPGPRLLASTEILAEILHPDLHTYGHCGEGWQPL